MLASSPELEDLAMTTNATLLPKYAKDLHAAGLQRITVSLDSLEPQTFHQLTRRDSLREALQGIDAAAKSGFRSLKINMVVLRDVNHREITSMLRFAKQVGAEIRFIEYMDVGGANKWRQEQVVSHAEILNIIEEEFGTVSPLQAPKHAPAQTFSLDSGQTFGIIASTTKPFCSSCDRSRITADGVWYHCLYSPSGINLRDHLRRDEGLGNLEALMTRHWTSRRDQGAKDRLIADNRGPLIPLSQLKRNPRLEMHTRGG
jgi:cyclic pyranopterin phosphate synthase